MTVPRRAPIAPAADPAAVIGTSTPNPARIYDYLLGGKDNFPADRETAEEVLALAPEVRAVARENRAFLRRAVRYLAGEAGIRQFLDVGTGIPAQGNVHQVAQQVAPDARVVYVDNDPIVLLHARALLAGNHTTIIQADLREPAAILDHPELREVIDFDQPVAVLLLAILHFITDEEDPAGIVTRLRDAMAPGSYLALSHGTADFRPEATLKAAQVYDRASAPLVLRSHAQIGRFFGGLELVAPGLVQVVSWRPDGELPDGWATSPAYGGIARKR